MGGRGLKSDSKCNFSSRHHWGTICFLVACLFLSALLTQVGGRSADTPASVIWVSAKGAAEFSTIQEAINNATSGDTILVDAGTYYENIVVNKSITIIGANREATIIEGKGSAPIVYVPASNVSVENFTIRNGTFYPHGGIHVYADRVSIKGNSIPNSNLGIYLYHCRQSFVADNEISNGNYGIWVDHGSTNTEIAHNIIANCQIGIYAGLESNFSTISANSFRGNMYGLELYTSNNTVFHNNFLNNTRNADSDRSGNAWQFGGEGNFWSDHTAFDEDNDGMSNEPYDIGPNNTDTAPLMGSFFEFRAGTTRAVQIVSNSTIYYPHFTGIAVEFLVSGPEDTIGFCRATIPNVLLNDTLRVFVNGTETSFRIVSGNETVDFRCIYFTYTQSAQEIRIVPEFHLSALVQLLIAISLFLAARRNGSIKTHGFH